MARPLRLSTLALLAVGLAACGAQPAAPGSAQAPLAPKGRRVVDLPQAGLDVTLPRNWASVVPAGPLAVGATSSGATVVVWRYGRQERLPQDAGELRRAQRGLLRAVRKRDPSFAVERVQTRKRAGVPAIELVGSETIGGRRVRVRSSHMFALGTEVVVDAYAPPEHFDRVDTTVFEPALASLRLRVPS